MKISITTNFQSCNNLPERHSKHAARKRRGMTHTFDGADNWSGVITIRPTKNRHYCQGCGRHKMQFEKEKNANNYLRYNSAAFVMQGLPAPVRSYYCTFCDCWHVTSNPDAEAGCHIDKMDQSRKQRFDAMVEEKNTKPAAVEKARKFVEDFAANQHVIAQALHAGDVGQSKLLLAKLTTRRDQIGKMRHPRYSGQLARAKRELATLQLWHDTLVLALQRPLEQSLALIAGGGEQLEHIGHTLMALHNIAQVEGILKKQRKQLAECKFHDFNDAMKSCEPLMTSLRQNGHFEAQRKRLNKEINDLYKIHKHMKKEHKRHRRALLVAIDHCMMAKLQLAMGNPDRCKLALDNAQSVIENLLWQTQDSQEIARHIVLAQAQLGNTCAA